MNVAIGPTTETVAALRADRARRIEAIAAEGRTACEASKAEVLGILKGLVDARDRLERECEAAIWRLNDLAEALRLLDDH